MSEYFIIDPGDSDTREHIYLPDDLVFFQKEKKIADKSFVSKVYVHLLFSPV